MKQNKMSPSAMLYIAGGIVLAFLVIQGGRMFLEEMAENNLRQNCVEEAVEANHSMVTDQFAHSLACMDGYSYQRLPESVKQEYRQLVWDSVN